MTDKFTFDQAPFEGIANPWPLDSTYVREVYPAFIGATSSLIVHRITMLWKMGNRKPVTVNAHEFTQWIGLPHAEKTRQRFGRLHYFRLAQWDAAQQRLVFPVCWPNLSEETLRRAGPLTANLHDALLA